MTSSEVEIKYATRIMPLDVRNYVPWSFEMKMLLIEKELWDAICKDSPSAKVDMKALACIALNTKQHHHSLLAKAKSAKEAWELLKSLYGTQGNAGRMRLVRELFESKLGQDSMVEYVGKVRALRDKLNDIEDTMSETMAVLFLLNGLPESYDMYKTVLMTQKDDVTFDAAFETLLQAEIALKANSATTIPRLYSAVSSGGPVCWGCGKSGHVKRLCPNVERDFTGNIVSKKRVHFSHVI
jgi:gag-polypeptide of LTR copia-type